MILIIRGHIRDSFKTNNLYLFLKEMLLFQPDIKIFVHTWGIFSNGVSWRPMTADTAAVTDQVIYEYFQDLAKYIQHIIIDDEKHNELHGSLTGTINGGPMPLVGWKNYWCGQYRIIDHLYTNELLSSNDTIVNMRFDILNNSCAFDKNTLLAFIALHSQGSFKKNMFLFDCERNGIDNIYIGNIKTMYRLIRYFHYELDDILKENKDTVHQERLVYRINNLMFA